MLYWMIVTNHWMGAVYGNVLNFGSGVDYRALRKCNQLQTQTQTQTDTDTDTDTDTHTTAKPHTDAMIRPRPPDNDTIAIARRGCPMCSTLVLSILWFQRHGPTNAPLKSCKIYCKPLGMVSHGWQ